ncbi:MULTISPECIES: Sec-independent protein translocase subunit TatA [unclassified Streptomyces]|uniref:Sec-independent protein translocase subunit TatA n=1 Tax=unclassified Streptomyces TaxID=2593676 RepID=UPI00380E7B78
MFGRLGAPEIVLVLAVVALLFGAKRLPDIARSFGQSLRILKSETKAMQRENTGERTSPTPTLQSTPDHHAASQKTPPEDVLVEH